MVGGRENLFFDGDVTYLNHGHLKDHHSAGFLYARIALHRGGGEKESNVTCNRGIELSHRSCSLNPLHGSSSFFQKKKTRSLCRDGDCYADESARVQ